MTFKTNLAADMVNTIMNVNEFADTCTYTVFATSAAASVPVILDIQTDLASIAPGQAALGTAILNKADVADPQRYDTIAASGVTWRVESIVSGDGYQWTVAVSSDQRLA